MDDYLKLLTSKLSLSHSYSPEDEEDCAEASIPINLISEENMAHRFMENIKALIRSSLEYKLWVKWFKNEYGPPICSVSDNTTTIEIHHHPLTLEDYVDIALSFIYKNNLTYSSPLIADLVMRWHYMGIVGACFMSKTYHMRFHEDHDISIPENSIHGDFKTFFTDPIISNHITSYMIDKFVNYCPVFCNENQDIVKIKIENT